MLFQTTQAHEQLRAKIRAFAEEEVKPSPSPWIRPMSFRPKP